MFSEEELCMIRDAIQSHVELVSNIRDGAGPKHPWHDDPDASESLDKFVELDVKVSKILSEE